MAKRILPSFARGEIDPRLFGRVDTAIYQIGLATGRNVVVQVFGGVSSRPGTRYLAPVKDHSYAPIIKRFQFKTTDTYILEFGDKYMRVMRNDGHVIQQINKKTITGVTAANPAVVSSTAHGFSNGQSVRITNIVGMTELNNRTFVAANVTADTFELQGENSTLYTPYASGGRAVRIVLVEGIANTDPVVVTSTGHPFSNGDEVFISGTQGIPQVEQGRFTIGNSTADSFALFDQVTGAAVDGASFGVYIGGGTIGRIFEIETPYERADLRELNFTQSADVMTIAHKSYDIRELSRLDDDEWTLEVPTFGPTVAFPDGITLTRNNAAASETYRYRVTAIAEDTGEESLPGISNTGATITATTQANPVRVAATAHGFSNGDEILIQSVVGMTELNGRRFIVANSDPNNFDLSGEDGSGYSAYVSGGTAATTFVRITDGNATADNTISWTAVAGAERYNVYKFRGGTYGFIGETEGLTFDDDNIAADTGLSPPRARNPFEGANDKPGAVSFFEQRRVFGGTNDQPDTSFYSQTGNISNFNVSFPLRADDAITATLTSREVNEIRHFVPGNDLIVFTSGGEWEVNSGPDAAFGPDTIKQAQQSEYGCSFLAPIRIGEAVLFLGSKNSVVRSLGYNFQSDTYASTDVLILSRHLVEGKTITDWDFVTQPETRVYASRSDGALLAFTFEQQQEVAGWTRWDTSGAFESVASLPTGGKFTEDSLYLVVRRTVGGQFTRGIEVSRETFFDDVRDVFAVDGGLSFDVPFTITGVSQANPVVVTAPNHDLLDGDEVDIADVIFDPIPGENGEESQPTDQTNNRRFTVANSTDDTFELQGIDGTAWRAYVSGGVVRRAVNVVGGLEHLEGRTVNALADGSVFSGLTVTNGSITLEQKASRIHVGLGYIVDIETLNLTSGQGTIQGLKKNTTDVIARVHKSRGGLIGPNKNDLTEIKYGEDDFFDEPTALVSTDLETTIISRWDQQGRIFMRQIDPLPLTVLAFIPDVSVEDDEAL